MSRDSGREANVADISDEIDSKSKLNNIFSENLVPGGLVIETDGTERLNEVNNELPDNLLVGGRWLSNRMCLIKLSRSQQILSIENVVAMTLGSSTPFTLQDEGEVQTINIEPFGPRLINDWWEDQHHRSTTANAPCDPGHCPAIW